MASPTTLPAVLDAELRCAEEMLAALEREAQALLDPQHTGLDAAIAAKNGLLAALESLERERAELAEGETSASPRARERWAKILDIVGRCRELNRRNGVLLGARRAGIERILATLRDGALPPYGADGRPPRPGAGRALGSA